jgi:hypothetical protein
VWPRHLPILYPGSTEEWSIGSSGDGPRMSDVEPDADQAPGDDLRETCPRWNMIWVTNRSWSCAPLPICRHCRAGGLGRWTPTTTSLVSASSPMPCPTSSQLWPGAFCSFPSSIIYVHWDILLQSGIPRGYFFCDGPRCTRCQSGRGGFAFRWIGPWTCRSLMQVIAEGRPLEQTVEGDACQRRRGCSSRRLLARLGQLHHGGGVDARRQTPSQSSQGVVKDEEGTAGVMEARKVRVERQQPHRVDAGALFEDGGLPGGGQNAASNGAGGHRARALAKAQGAPPAAQS